MFDALSLCMQGWFSPLWVAFAILIGGLLLDVLISVSLGVSALPVNIIIGMEQYFCVPDPNYPLCSVATCLF